MSIRGYLVLPDAFSQTVDYGWLRSMNARAFAAMRELNRFQTHFDYEHGYPMHYQESKEHPILFSSLKGKLFDNLYYFDGNGDHSRLNLTDIKHGLAPMISDAISTATDGESGPALANYVSNVEAERINRITRGDLAPQTDTVGSIGAYSIVFPINQIVESWTIDLGLEVLNRLVLPDMTQLDKRTGIPRRLLPNANQENPGEDGRNAASSFLRPNKPAIYQTRDEYGNVHTQQAEPTKFFGELARISELTVRPGSAILEVLTKRTITEWSQLFFPSGENQEAQQLVYDAENVLNTRLYAKGGKLGAVQASDQMKPKEEPSVGAERIQYEVRRFKARLWGDDDLHTGRLLGGVYRSMLSQVAEYQLTRFNFYLTTYVQGMLNGSPNRPGFESRGGKLGYLAVFFEELVQLLVRVQETMRLVQRREERDDRRFRATAKAQTALNRMKDLSSKKGVLGTPARDAFQSQHAYLLAELQLTEILQTEAWEDVVLDTITQMLDCVASARDALQTWVQILVNDPDSLYAQLQKGRKQVDSNRSAEKEISCRYVLSDENYEKKRYAEYLATRDGGWVDALLRSLTWEMRVKMEGKSSKFDLVLKIVGMDEKSYPLVEKAGNNNLITWLGFCQAPFESARQNESIIGYLVNDPSLANPQRFAESIYKHDGVSLNTIPGNPLNATFICAYYQTEEEAGHRVYLRHVMEYIAAMSGQSTSGYDNVGSKLINSEDRSKLTIIFTQELIELKNLSAYREYIKAYLDTSGQKIKDYRRLLHIFPAEVHAAEYEDRLPVELKQPMRLLSDEATLQMEDMAQLKLFLMCYVYGLIKQEATTGDKSSESMSVFKLLIPPENEYDQFGNPMQTEEIGLTNPIRNPTMLEAINAFNRRVAKYEDVYKREIDYGAISKALQRERKKDVAHRLQEMNFRKYNQDLFSQVQTISDENNKRDLLEELAYIERISEFHERLEKDILSYFAKKLGDPNSQREYDIASVFLLMLNDEVTVVRQSLKDRIRTFQDQGMIKNSEIVIPGKINVLLHAEPFKAKIGDQIDLSISMTSENQDGAIQSSMTKDITFVIDAPGFYIPEGKNKITVPASSDDISASLKLTALVAGENQIRVDTFLDNTLQKSTKFTVSCSREKVKKDQEIVALLPNPLGFRPIEHPDLVIRCYATVLEDNRAYLSYILYSPHKDFRLTGNPLGGIEVDLNEYEHLMFRLYDGIICSSQKYQNMKDVEEIGRKLFDIVLPKAVKKIYFELSEKFKSLLILTNSSLWIPWELIRPYRETGSEQQEFWSERYEIGRWIEGWGALRASEFPIGQVLFLPDNKFLARYDAQEWTEMLAKGDIPKIDTELMIDHPGGLSFALDVRSPIWGLHFASAEGDNDITTQQMAVWKEAPSIPTELRPLAIDISTKRTLITFGTVSTELSQRTNLEKTWVTQFIQNGASAFAGNYWSTDPQNDQLFWRAFYQAVWNKASLGTAMKTAREYLRTASPDSLDWLAYYLVGDPKAKGYLPKPGDAYAVLECLNHDVSKPMTIGQTYSFRASLRLSPPAWFERRLHQPGEFDWEAPRIQIIAPDFDIEQDEIIVMSEKSQKFYEGNFELSPKKSGELDATIYFIDQDEIQQTLSFSSESIIGKKPSSDRKKVNPPSELHPLSPPPENNLIKGKLGDNKSEDDTDEVDPW
jgi:hypothetical protein